LVRKGPIKQIPFDLFSKLKKAKRVEKSQTGNPELKLEVNQGSQLKAQDFKATSRSAEVVLHLQDMKLEYRHFRTKHLLFWSFIDFRQCGSVW